jgi:hypothetical protein
MSGGYSCSCKVKDHKNWVVLKRHYRQSAFDGYRVVYSDFSTVLCLACGSCWRTKAGYVDSLKDYKGN